MSRLTPRELPLLSFPFRDEFFHVGDLLRVGLGVLADLDSPFARGDRFSSLALLSEYARPQAQVADRFPGFD